MSLVRKKVKIDFKYDLKVYWNILKSYKLLFIALLFVTLILEVSSILEKFLYKSVIDNATKFAGGLILKQAFLGILLSIVLIYSVILASRVIGRWISTHLINNLDRNLIWDLKKKFFNHIVHLSHHFHTTHKTGSLISRLSRGGSAIERMTDSIIFNFAPTILQMILVISTVIFFDVAATIVIILTSVVFILYNFYFQQIQKESRAEFNNAEDFEKANIGDIFTNIDSIKYFGKEYFIKNKFLKITENTKRAAMRNWNYARWLDSGQALILGIGTFFVLYFTLVKFLSGQMTIGTIVFIYSTYGSLVGYMFNFVHGMREFYRVMADFDSLFRYGKIENEVKDKLHAKEMKVHEGTIEFDNLSFSYAKRKIFENLKLKIRPHEKIALVGRSGSGKSTLVKLLFRFYDLNDGKITIEGIDIKDFKQESLRSEMSVVPQECVLFDDTVYNNIAFSNPHASREEVMQAIKFAQLDRIIKKFPKNEKTIVGERGVKLSGGEKQRVSIARAILANKKILVLDEATSSLDSETEHEIQKDLKELMKGRTSIIIAHRLSTIMTADRIIVMKDGKIVQQGRHSELIEQPGEYRKLWHLQKGGYIK